MGRTHLFKICPPPRGLTDCFFPGLTGLFFGCGPPPPTWGSCQEWPECPDRWIFLDLLSQRQVQQRLDVAGCGGLLPRSEPPPPNVTHLPRFIFCGGFKVLSGGFIFGGLHVWGILNFSEGVYRNFGGVSLQSKPIFCTLWVVVLQFPPQNMQFCPKWRNSIGIVSSTCIFPSFS